MKKLSTTLSLVLLGISNLFSQTIDTVSTSGGYANDNYYQLSSGAEFSVVRNNWDLAFACSGLGGQSSTIRINGGTGTKLYLYSNNINDWTTVDTNGFDWNQNQLFNSDTSWTVGAFNSLPSGGSYDLGWGTYNIITHLINGDRIFILTLSNGTYKKLIVEGLSSGIYNIKYADLDGNNEITDQVTKSTYTGQNFGYYSLQNQTALNRETVSTDWDLVFTKYITMLAPNTPYAVTGVLANANVKVAQINNVPDVNNIPYTSQTYSNYINTIGYDWKTFNMTTFQYEIEDSLVYFVEDQVGDIYKVIFTGFGGSSNGNYIFSKEFVGTVGINEDVKNNIILNAYPNPATDVVNITFNAQSNSTQLSIVDLTGKQVVNEQINVGEGLNQHQISVSNLTKGIYFLKLVSGNHSSTQKLIIR